MPDTKLPQNTSPHSVRTSLVPWGGYYDTAKNLENFQESFDPVFEIIKNLEESKDINSMKEILSIISPQDRNKLNSPVLDAFLESFSDFPKNVFYNGNAPACDFILERGFTEYEVALKLIIESSHDPVEMIGIMDKNCPNYRILHETLNNYLIKSVEKQHINKVTFLLAASADHTAKNCSAFSIACEKGNLSIVRLFIEYDRTIANHELSLILACSCGHLEIVKFLAENGANIRIRGETPLLSACSGNYLELVKFLVERGAYINTTESLPLRLACRNGHREIVEYLLVQGCNVNIPTFCTPLYYASTENRLEIVKLLITHGADINIGNGYILSSIYSKGNMKMLEFLLDNGGDIGAGTMNNIMESMINNKDINGLELILRRGARINVNPGSGTEISPEVKKLLEKYGRVFLE